MTPAMFRPDKNYLTKILLEASLIGFFVIAALGWLGYLIGRNIADSSMGSTGLIIGLLTNLFWIIPSILVLNRYYHSLHYEIHEDEVIMHVGVITKTVKHVPFRTVTNLKIKRGPFDRIFGLGTIDVQTAGRSGESGAEESLVGLSDVREVYNQIVSQLRRLPSGQSVSSGHEVREFSGRTTVEDMIEELQRIRKLIKEKL